MLRATPHGNEMKCCAVVGRTAAPQGEPAGIWGSPAPCAAADSEKNTHCQKFPHGCIFLKLTQQIRAKFASYRDHPMLMFRSGS